MVSRKKEFIEKSIIYIILSQYPRGIIKVIILFTTAQQTPTYTHKHWYRRKYICIYMTHTHTQQLYIWVVYLICMYTGTTESDTLCHTLTCTGVHVGKAVMCRSHIMNLRYTSTNDTSPINQVTILFKRNLTWKTTGWFAFLWMHFFFIFYPLSSCISSEPN